MKKLISEKGYPAEVLQAITDLLDAFNPEIIPDTIETWRELLETASQARTLSNDALVALASLKQGIQTIISLDSDFDRVPWLKRVTP